MGLKIEFALLKKMSESELMEVEDRKNDGF